MTATAAADMQSAAPSAARLERQVELVYDYAAMIQHRIRKMTDPLDAESSIIAISKEIERSIRDRLPVLIRQVQEAAAPLHPSGRWRSLILIAEQHRSRAEADFKVLQMAIDWKQELKVLELVSLLVSSEMVLCARNLKRIITDLKGEGLWQ